MSSEAAGAAPIQTRTELASSATAEGSTEQAAQVTASVAGAGGTLPHRDRIQASFGRHDVSGVRAFVGGEAGEQARAIGASAFATGDAVAFAGGPDLHTAAHEAAHVVQQRAGVVALKGINPSGSIHEQHADAVADEVVGGRSAEALLDAMPSGGGAAAHGAIQRGPEATKDPLVAAESAAPRLDPADLQHVREDAKIRLVRTEIHFFDAANALKSAIEARAKQNMEFACLVIDIALGMYLPGLGAGLAKIASSIPTKSPNLLYRVALPLTDEAVARVAIQSATKVGTSLLKTYAADIGGATATSAFLNSLKTRFSIGTDSIQHRLNEASDTEVVAVWAAFDPRVTNRDTYLAALAGLVARFHGQVEPIAEHSLNRTLHHDITTTTHAFHVADEGGTVRLAVLRKKDFVGRSAVDTSQTYYDFISWVTPDMQSLVLARTREVGGQPVEVQQSQVDALEPYGAQP